jgi:CDP-glucose 4,6-dehydratase
MTGHALDIYEGKTVLVTGSSGFKGSWLSIWLVELGAKVVGYSLGPPTEPSMFDATDLTNKYVNIIGDVRDEKHLLSTFEAHQPDFVFHLAAQPIVRRSYKEPRLTYETNVMGTVNLLEAVRKTESARVVIVVTSDKCYQNKESIYGCREIDPMGGDDPYSSSKGCVELVVSAYRASFFDCKNGSKKVALASVRAGNVVGGGDWGQDRLVPDCIRALSGGNEIVIRNPASVRPWQYVLEPLGGYLLLGTKMLENIEKYAGAWNFGPSENDAISVEEIVKKIIVYWGNGQYRLESAPNEPHEARSLRLDCSKARAMIGWEPAYTINEALMETVAWYTKFYEKRVTGDLYDYTVKQIMKYMAKSGFRADFLKASHGTSNSS